MNTIPATFVVDGGEAFVDLGSGRFPLAAVGGEAVVDGAKVVVGVRPEHLQIGPGPVTATVVAVEWLGHERHIVCDLAGDKVTIREPSSAEARVEGSEVRLTADPAQVHLFSPDTTERLN